MGTYADKIGRLKTIEIGCAWALLGGILQATAQNFTWMALARVIGGIGCGHLNSVVPIWSSELADPNLRGAFVAVQFTVALAGTTVYETPRPVTDLTGPLGFECFVIGLTVYLEYTGPNMRA